MAAPPPLVPSPRAGSDAIPREEYRGVLLRLAASLGADPDRAEEIVREAFASYARARLRGHQVAPLGYLRRAVINLARTAVPDHGVRPVGL